MNKKIKTAYLGPKGTFTEKVAKENMPETNLISLSPIRAVIRAVETQEADFGVVPLENFYQGEVRETLDSLTECSNTKIIKETYIPIVHCLGALQNHQQIEKILSKDQALSQCSKYLSKYYSNATTISTASTSEAVNIIQQQNQKNSAAIASEKAIQESGLEILAKDLCPNNKTKFVIVGRQETKPTGNDKTFLAIHPHIIDKPGVLNDILSTFATMDINLEYIQSRPDGKGGYYFYVEFDGHQKDEKIKHSIQGIELSLDEKKQYPDTIKFLGSYQNSGWKK
jgi:prephenate dehydratase